jgi:hypothetical protein
MVRSGATQLPGSGPTATATDKAPTKTNSPAGVYKSVLISDVPHVRQKPDFCGEACAAMYLRKLGRPVDQDYVFDASGLDPREARGCYTKELATALESIGFRTGSVWYKIPAAGHDKSLEAQWKALHADLLGGVPSIVCMHYDEKPNASEHFRLILGYDAGSDEVIYHEAAVADGAYRRMKKATFLKLWPLKYDSKQWTLIRLRLEPGELKPGTGHRRAPKRSFGRVGPRVGHRSEAWAPTEGWSADAKGPSAAETFTAADYAQHLMKLKKKVPAKGFTIVIQPPFVVIGDETPAMVGRHAEGTVKWAVDKLKQAYFAKDPTQILDIWLFRDAASYQQHCKSIFHQTPTTPYGYFSQAEGALIMNIETGGGTLVHEIVHPFMAANFPECPAWFNEGLGSLYEQSWEVDGKIQGRTNWRLAGLQEAIRDKRVPSFKTLCSTTDYEFYQKDPGTNYAQARYLCYYLQEHGLLREFYRAFCANRKEDPTGYGTLKAVLRREDMEKFQKDWEAYVLKLRFP